MGNLDATLGEIKQLEKSAGVKTTPPAFSKEEVGKFVEASTAFKVALEAVEKNQSDVVKATTHGEAIAVARAAMLGLEGTMSLIWEENGLNDTIRGQFTNVISLLEPMTKTSTEKSAAPVTETPSAPAPASDTPAAKPDGEPAPVAKSAAEEADAGEKNTPEGHSEGTGGDPADPEKVAWPKDLNTDPFRKNEQKDETPSWGEDPKPAASTPAA